MAEPPTRVAVFLDRDGVLNAPIVRDGVPHPPSTQRDFTLLPGVPEACQSLREAGFVLLVVTNQPDIARGVQERSVVDGFHDFLRQTLPIDEVYLCPHDDRDGCECRKPSPGMLLRGAQDRNVDLSRSFMVGDRWRDIEAGHRAGCHTVYIDRGYTEKPPVNPGTIVGDLGEAAARIKAHGRRV
jgi:D-glycero-D-manno-heptose 1,7-bisphosphate phosphatase